MLSSNEKEWGEIVWKGVTWRIKDVEFMRNGMGDGGFKKSGLIVVVGEAGSSSTLDALEVLEAKGDGKE
jgi:hypothetical protein